MADKNQEFLNEFSPQFFATGLAGMFQNSDVEKVEIQIVFHKKRSAEIKEGTNLHQPTSQGQNGTAGKPQVGECTISSNG